MIIRFNNDKIKEYVKLVKINEICIGSFSYKHETLYYLAINNSVL